MAALDAKGLVEPLFPFLVDIRRRLHMYPEPSGKEYETTRVLQEELESEGISCIRPTATGCVAVVKGKKEGKTIALRADIDALPVHELTDLPFSSRKDGVMHACGHDGHAAALLGAAKILHRHREHWQGTVMLVFQPSEEYLPSGALAMVESGILDGVGAVMGLHIKTDIPVGSCSVEAGPRMAASAGVDIRIKGKGGHGGTPHEAVDAIVAGAAIISNLQTIVSRELDKENSSILSIGTFTAGTGKNIIAEEAVMSGTCRFYSPDLLPVLRESITRVVQNTAAAFRANAEVSVEPGCPAVINDGALSEIGVNAAETLWGKESIILYPKSSLNEDFSHYAAIAPIHYAMIGARNEHIGCVFPHHSPYFTLDEASLPLAAQYYVQFALDYLAHA
jgi:amidohydrolase